MSADLDILEQTLRASGDPVLLAECAEAPLPEGIDTILALMTGQSERLHSAADRLGIDPDTLLYAMRCYVREVMLHPAADDARMLGLTAHSGPDDLKRNYRALQSWLHPDRMDGPDDASNLSARINAAWSRLRAARRTQSSGNTLMAFRPRWQKVEVQAKPPPRRWVTVASIAPILLALTVAVMMDLRPQDTDASGRTAEPAPDLDPATAPAAAIRWRPARDAGEPGVPLAAQARDPADRHSHDPDLTQAPGQTVRIAAASATPRSVQAATDDVRQRAGRQGPETLRHDATRTQAPVAAAPTRRPERANQPRTLLPGEPADRAPDAVAAAARTLPASPPDSAHPERAGRIRPEPSARTAARPEPLQQAEGNRLPPIQPAVAALETPVASEPESLAAPSPAQPAPDVIDDLAHVDRARAQGASLLDYLTGRRDNAPPIWHSGSALTQAETARKILISGRRAQAARPRRDLAHWHFGTDRAEGRIPIEPADRRLDTQIALVQMIWKNDDWWVAQIALESSQ